ncbi:uncharacterized protein DMAD_05120 [Drosophila madeirensis]|uniref:Uncharacterized protein n=1 Tax=Drosophila madeirensis TaxID=30013 RepID=A0AAU9FL23_DROMD
MRCTHWTPRINATSSGNVSRPTFTKRMSAAASATTNGPEYSYAKPGQEVYRRNFTLSDFGKSYNAKFARKFLKCRVVRPVGNNAFELVDLAGKPVGKL